MNSNGMLNLIPDVSLRREARKVIVEEFEIPLFLRPFPLYPINSMLHVNNMISRPKYTDRSNQGANKYHLRQYYSYKPKGPIEIMAQLGNRHYGIGGCLMASNLFAPGGTINPDDEEPKMEPVSHLQYVEDTSPTAFVPKKDNYGRYIIPTFAEWAGKDAKFFDPYPKNYLIGDSKNTDWTNYDAYREYVSRLNKANEGKGPRDINAERARLGLRPVGFGSKWTDDLRYFGYPLMGAMSLPALSLAGTGELAELASTVGNGISRGANLLGKLKPGPLWGDALKKVLWSQIGGTGVNLVSQATTGKTFDEHSYNVLIDDLGVNPTVAGILSPFANLGYAFTGQGINSLFGLNGKPLTYTPSRRVSTSKVYGKGNEGSTEFKSELDWSPESWFGTRPKGIGYDAEDIAALQSHVPEYLEIERVAKANGTWLRMPDGSLWQGDPRSWVQLMSKDGQKLVKRRLLGSTRSRERSLAYPEDDSHAWTVEGDNAEIFADKWTGKYYDPEHVGYGGETFELTYPENARIFRYDGSGAPYHSLPHPDPRHHRNGYKTLGSDQAVNYIDDRGWGNVTQIDNVLEGTGDIVNDVVIHEGFPRKSLLGNNGNFDLSNKNIYKGLIPFIVGGTGYYSFSNK